MKPDRVFVAICNDKGGVGKSLLAAQLAGDLASKPEQPWTIVEIEQRSRFTQQIYAHPEGTRVIPIALLEHDDASNQTDLSLSPMDRLWDLIPGGPEADARILADFGASAFQSFALWGVQHRGLQPLREAGFRFIFFIPVQAGDAECAGFFNTNAGFMLKLGDVVLVRNMRQGADFRWLDDGIKSQVKTIDLLFKGRPLTDEMQQRDHRLTFRQVASLATASRRARLDAAACAEEFARQFTSIRPSIGL